MVTEVKISELPAASSANGTMQFEVNDSGTSKRVTGDQVKDLVVADTTLVKTTGDQTIGGVKTFSSTISGSISGNAGTATTATNIAGGAAGNIPMQTAAGTTSFYSGQLAGMRNKIINGKMEIAQRGTSFAAIANNAYSVDRFAHETNTAAVIRASQESDAPSDNTLQFSLRYTVTTADTSIAAGDLTSIRHFIEGYNARDLIGRTFTLSFWVRSSKTGTHCVFFHNNGNDRSYVAEYTISAANTWEFKTVTVSGGLPTAGTWNWTNGRGLAVGWTLAAGSNFQTTAGAWQTGAFRNTANQVNCLDAIGNIFAITGVQLEVGSVATPFEHRPYGAELALCQRYLPAWNWEAGNDAVGLGYSYATTSTFIHVAIPVAPRVKPTGVTTSAMTNFVLRNANNNGGTPTAITANVLSSGVNQTLTVTSNAGSPTIAAGDGAWLFASGAAQILFIGCEL